MRRRFSEKEKEASCEKAEGGPAAYIGGGRINLTSLVEELHERISEGTTERWKARFASSEDDTNVREEIQVLKAEVVVLRTTSACHQFWHSWKSKESLKGVLQWLR